MKKNSALFMVILCLFVLKSSAQESIIGEVKYQLLEQYIQAAKAYYPKRKIVERQKEMAKIGVTTAAISYLDMFDASYFYRPDDKTAIIGQGDVYNPYIVNGIQYGISLNLGQFVSRPFAIKRAKSEYKVAELQAQDFDISLALEVKKKYYTYIQTLSELKIKTQTAQENRVVADNAGKKFENGEVSLENYNGSRKILADANSSQIAAEVAFLNAKDDLEAIIGKKLTDFK